MKTKHLSFLVLLTAFISCHYSQSTESSEACFGIYEIAKRAELPADLTDSIALQGIIPEKETDSFITGYLPNTETDVFHPYASNSGIRLVRSAFLVGQDKRYRKKYPMSMMENLETIRLQGTKIFLQMEQKRWLCPECGGLICVHKGFCLKCRDISA